jgi:hypothetical protein
MGTPGTFVVPEIKHDADLISAFHDKGQSLTRQIAELDAVLEILDAPAWTAQDFEEDDTGTTITLADDGTRILHGRFDRLCLEVDRHRLLGQDGFSQGLDGHRREVALAESPFWHCVQEAKEDVRTCLTVHQGGWINHFTNVSAYPLQPMSANTPNAQYGTPYGREYVPGGDGQVFVAFSLATLLYATFEIPIPDRQATPLWEALRVSHRGRVVPVFQCLDLAYSVNRGRRNDYHGLKPNLHNDVFVINGVGNTNRSNRTKWKWDEQPVKPWRAVLCELAGYTKYAQAGLPHKPALCPLDEVRKLCSQARQQFQQKLTDLDTERVAYIDI